MESYSYLFLQCAHVLVTVRKVDWRIGVENLNSWTFCSLGGRGRGGVDMSSSFAHDEEALHFQCNDKRKQHYLFIFLGVEVKPGVGDLAEKNTFSAVGK